MKKLNQFLSESKILLHEISSKENELIRINRANKSLIQSIERNSRNGFPKELYQVLKAFNDQLLLFAELLSAKGSTRKAP